MNLCHNVSKLSGFIFSRFPIFCFNRQSIQVDPRPKQQHSQQQPHKGAKASTNVRCGPAQSALWREGLQQWRSRIEGAATESWRWAVRVWCIRAPQDRAPGAVSDPSRRSRQQHEPPQQGQSLTQPVLGQRTGATERAMPYSQASVLLYQPPGSTAPWASVFTRVQPKERLPTALAPYSWTAGSRSAGRLKTHTHRTLTHASDGYEFLSDREYLQTHMYSVTFKAIFPLKPQPNFNRT